MNNNNKESNIKNTISYSFDKNLFNGELFKHIPLSDSIDFEVTFNPNEKLIMEDRKKWLLETNAFKSNEKFESFLSYEIESITSGLYSFLDYEAFFFSTKIYDYGFIIDDDYFETDYFTKETQDTFLDIKSKKQLEIGTIYWDIIKKFRGIGHPGNLDRIIEGNKRWTIASINANKENVYNSGLSYEEYASIRSGEIGGDFALSLIMAGHDLYLTEEKYNSTEILKMRYYYTYIGFLSNDYCSFHKEIDDPKMSNIVKVFSIQLGSIQKAINKIYELLVYNFTEFIKFHKLAVKANENDEAALVFLERFKLLAFGTYHMHFFSNRYHLNGFKV